MALLVPAVESAHLGVFAAVMLAGLAIGVFGHIISSRPLIVAGILIIALASVYFSFVLQPTGR